jgi:hypothetical protein
MKDARTCEVGVSSLPKLSSHSNKVAMVTALIMATMVINVKILTNSRALRKYTGYKAKSVEGNNSLYIVQLTRLLK